MSQVLLDVEDRYLLEEFKWNTLNSGYLAASVYGHFDGSEKKELRTFLMHRIICGLERGDKRQVDHINRNKLDNRKANLRILTRQENQFNRVARKGNFSKIKGVSFDKKRNGWVARIKVCGQCIPLGFYATAEEGGRAYDKELLKRFPAGRTNFPAL